MQTIINYILLYLTVIIGLLFGVFLMKIRFRPLYDLYTFIPKWIYKRYKKAKKRAKELFKARMDKEFEGVNDYVEVVGENKKEEDFSETVEVVEK